MSNDTLANAAKMLELQAQLEKLQAENARLTAQANAKVTVKYTEPYMDERTGEEKGGTVSVYGLQRFPVSLRPTQWQKVFKIQGLIEAECTPERIEFENRKKAEKKASK